MFGRENIKVGISEVPLHSTNLAADDSLKLFTCLTQQSTNYCPNSLLVLNHHRDQGSQFTPHKLNGRLPTDNRETKFFTEIYSLQTSVLFGYLKVFHSGDYVSQYFCDAGKYYLGFSEFVKTVLGHESTAEPATDFQTTKVHILSLK